MLSVLVSSLTCRTKFLRSTLRRWRARLRRQCPQSVGSLKKWWLVWHTASSSKVSLRWFLWLQFACFFFGSYDLLASLSLDAEVFDLGVLGGTAWRRYYQQSLVVLARSEESGDWLVWDRGMVPGLVGPQVLFFVIQLLFTTRPGSDEPHTFAGMFLVARHAVVSTLALFFGLAGCFEVFTGPQLEICSPRTWSRGGAYEGYLW